MNSPIDDVDAVLRAANLPTYTEVAKALKALAVDVGFSTTTDTHTLYKAWVLLDLLDRADPSVIGAHNADSQKN